MRRSLLIVTATLISRSTSAQISPKQTGQFDVASIRLSSSARLGGEGSRSASVKLSPTSVAIRNGDLSFVVQWAYDVKFYQVSSRVKLPSERYDITAQIDTPADAQSLKLLMQNLLADRFNLLLHRGTKTVPVYELSTLGGDPKIRRADGDEPVFMGVVNGSFVFQHVTMAQFAERASELSAIDRPVLDKTGIDGVYDITLESAASAMLADPESIFGAFERAGFRLNSRKRPMDVLVIDRADKPSAN